MTEPEPAPVVEVDPESNESAPLDIQNNLVDSKKEGVVSNGQQEKESKGEGEEHKGMKENNSEEVEIEENLNKENNFGDANTSEPNDVTMAVAEDAKLTGEDGKMEDGSAGSAQGENTDDMNVDEVRNTDEIKNQSVENTEATKVDHAKGLSVGDAEIKITEDESVKDFEIDDPKVITENSEHNSKEINSLDVDKADSKDAHERDDEGAIDKAENAEKEKEDDSKDVEMVDNVDMKNESRNEEAKHEEETETKLETNNKNSDMRANGDEDKGSDKKRPRGKKVIKKGEEGKDVNGKAKFSSPITPTIERPVRERKSVERLVEVIEKEPTKDFQVEKGRGTPLKDIPNVAHKIARKKPLDLTMVHQLLFGRKGKAVNFKSHILQFSGFAWHESDEKQRAKMKEKLDKHVKDTLLDLCDLFDISASRANSKKEDLVNKLLDFLIAPHATTDVLLSEDQLSAKSKKRKRVAKGSASKSKGDTPMKLSRKKKAKGEDSPAAKGSSDEESEEGEDEEEGENVKEKMTKHSKSEKESDSKRVAKGSASKSKGDTPNKLSRKKKAKGEDSPAAKDSSDADSEAEEDEEEGENIDEKVPKHSMSEKESDSEPDREDNVDDESLGKGKPTKKKASKGTSSASNEKSKVSSSKKKTSSIAPASNEKSKVSSSKKKPSLTVKSPSSTAKSPKTPSTKHVKIDEDNGSGASRQKKSAESTKKRSTPKSDTKEKDSGKKPARGKSKAVGVETPSNEELRTQICVLLKEVDFNTATFTDILKQLAAHFKTDLTPRKASVKLLIQEELTKMAEEADEEEEDDEDEEDDGSAEDNPKPAGKKKVKA